MINYHCLKLSIPGLRIVLSPAVLQICGVQDHRPGAIRINKTQVDRAASTFPEDALLFFLEKR